MHHIDIVCSLYINEIFFIGFQITCEWIICNISASLKSFTAKYIAVAVVYSRDVLWNADKLYIPHPELIDDYQVE